MRGYFSIGIEGVSKAGNMGNLIRTAHGFGAAFVFTISQKMKSKDAMALVRRLVTPVKPRIIFLTMNLIGWKIYSSPKVASWLGWK